MLVTLLLMLSAALIGAGAALLLRDWLQKRRMAFVASEPARQPRSVEEAEITIARTVPVRLDGAGAPLQPVDHPSAVLPPLRATEAEAGARTERIVPPPAEGLEARSVPAARPAVHDRRRTWSQLLPRVDAAVVRANTRLADRSLALTARRLQLAGQPAAEHGATYPVAIAGRREAWLRIELDLDGHLSARATALALNGAAEPQREYRIAPGDASDADIDALLDDCLLPLAPPAAPAQPQPQFRLPEAEITTQRRSDAQDEAVPGDGVEARIASERAWRASEGTLTAALRATNRALGQVDTRLVELAKPQWDPGQQRHRLSLALVVSGGDAARVHIDRLAHEFEIAVTGNAAGAREIGRRRRLPVDGMTVQALAELIAGCVWPTVTRVRDKRPSAGSA